MSRIETKLGKSVNHLPKKDMIVIEIGVNRALTAKLLLEKFNIKKYYLIDPYLSQDVFKRNRKKDMEIAKKKLSKYKDITQWIIDTSDNAINKIDNNIANLLFIDGNHKPHQVRKDSENYIHKVKDQGIIVFDDYNEAPKTIEEFAQKHNFKLNKENNIAWLIKK